MWAIREKGPAVVGELIEYSKARFIGGLVFWGLAGRRDLAGAWGVCLTLKDDGLYSKDVGEMAGLEKRGVWRYCLFSLKGEGGGSLGGETVVQARELR